MTSSPSPSSGSPVPRLLQRLYAASLRVYPREFRARFGPEMEQLFRDRCRDAAHSPLALAGVTASTAKDWLLTAIAERFSARKGTPMLQYFFSLRPIARALLVVSMLMLAGLGISVTTVEAFVISADSMEPSLVTGDHMFVTKLAHSFDRGELIVFRPRHAPTQSWVKRVIGLPGDRIHLEDKQVFVNGEALDEPYTEHVSNYVDDYRDNFPRGQRNVVLPGEGLQMLTQNVVDGELVVPPGALFVLGDNRDNSLDSRYWGFVLEADVVGRPWMVYWSFDQDTRHTRWDRTPLMLRP